MLKNMAKEFSGGFETLEVWKVARVFRKSISALVNVFSEEEKYLLKYQLLKSSRDIGTAIAQGYGRHCKEDMIDFCRIARGHLLKTLDHLYVAVDEKYISIQIFNLLNKESEHLMKLLNGYIGYLKKQDDDLSEDDLDMVMEKNMVYGSGLMIQQNL
jgi:four helix bundle protein